MEDLWLALWLVVGCWCVQGGPVSGLVGLSLVVFGSVEDLTVGRSVLFGWWLVVGELVNELSEVGGLEVGGLSVVVDFVIHPWLELE